MTVTVRRLLIPRGYRLRPQYRAIVQRRKDAYGYGAIYEGQGFGPVSALLRAVRELMMKG